MNLARILVTGGRGKTGSEVVRLLTASGVPVNAGTRNPGPRRGPMNPVRFDWQDPRTWVEAVTNVDSIFLMRPDLESAPQLVRELVRQAPDAHIVLLSEQGADSLSDSSWERQVEIAVTDHAASWTLLRPSWFHQVMDDPRFYLTAIRDGRMLPISSAGATIAFVDARDIAAVAVAALHDRALDGRAVTITGPESLSIAGAATILTRAVGSEVRPKDPSRDEATAGLDPWLSVIVGNMIDRVHAGIFSEVTDDVLRLTGRLPRSLTAFASERAEAWRPTLRESPTSPPSSTSILPPDADTKGTNMTSHTQQLHLLTRPSGEPRESDFALVTVPIASLAPGEVLVRNTWLSVDPYMRGRMNDTPSYIAPFELNAALEGSAVGEVIESRNAELPVGTRVSHFAGLREHSVIPGEQAMPIDDSEVSETAFLGPLGTTGLTAYAAVTRIAPVRDGDVVFVSGAAGAVGSVAGQLARRLGASRVIGSAGGASKVRALVEDFGYDDAIDYRAEDISERLAELAPDGIDVFIDNVGGAQLEAGNGRMRPHGRVAMVGAVSQYNQVGSATGPNNLYEAATKEVTLRGMLVTSHFDLMPEFLGRVVPWLADGSLRTRETVVEGIENAPAALLGVLKGANIGKMLVRTS